MFASTARAVTLALSIFGIVYGFLEPDHGYKGVAVLLASSILIGSVIIAEAIVSRFKDGR
jgi:hypothetical protein